MSDRLKIFIGWDSREDIAYQVARKSILSTTTSPVDIIPLKHKDLRKDGFYWRKKDRLASTEFTFTRFLVPELAEFEGWALFIDCDFIALDDVQKLFDLADDRYAVMCAHHDYTPKEGQKMDGKQQLNYPRKNWSSMMLFNCGHPSNKALTKDLVNDPEIDGKYLHRFSWLKDEEVGEISHEWNWLVGWYKEPKDGKPKFLHYTEGGPWFEEYYDCEYAAEWYKVERKYLSSELHDETAKVANIKAKGAHYNSLKLPPATLNAINALVTGPLDPTGKYYGLNEEEAMNVIRNKFMEGRIHKAAAIDPEEGITRHKEGLQYDEYLQSFLIGMGGGRLSDWDSEAHTDTPLVIRGLGGGSRKALHHCWETGRTFYAIDTGYFGNEKSKSKIWHRITKNELQNTQPIIDRPHDRLLSWKYKKFKTGKKILIVPPSDKVMRLWNQPDPEDWVIQIRNELKKHTDRPIEIRLKPDRRERITTKSMQQALEENVHCIVTYNSIAALEALNAGVPAIALGPNCASAVCNTSLADVESRLYRPGPDEMLALMAHLSYCQFTREEMMSGYAWNVVNDAWDQQNESS